MANPIGPGNPVHLDNNATTRPCKSAVEAAARCLRQHWHNASAVHRAGQEARREVELAREAVAALIDAPPRDIVFTSGGTEALQTVVRGVLEIAGGERPIVAMARTEHAALRDLGERFEHAATGPRVHWLAVDRHGVIDTAGLVEALSARPALVAAQWANNETGVVQPVREICERCAELGVPVLIDGTQWVGKMPTDVLRDAPMDFLVASPHKFHGVKGVGVLWARRGVRWRPQALGTQELGRRGGTENVPGIAAAGAAAVEARAWLDDPARREALASLRDEFEARVIELAPWASAHKPAPGGERLWNTTNIAFAGLEAEAMLIALSERGVYASAGAACSSGSLDPSPVLLAMGVEPRVAHGSVRFSLSRESTREEVLAGAAVIGACARALSGA